MRLFWDVYIRKYELFWHDNYLELRMWIKDHDELFYVHIYECMFT